LFAIRGTSSSGTNQVLRYHGTTWNFLGVFVKAGSGGLSNPRFLTFGSDGNPYVSSTNTNSVLRYNGTTGAFLGTFIQPNAGGLSSPGEFLFANGSVYVASQSSNEVLRYDATTGAFIEAAVSANSGGLDRPIGLLMDAGNNLLVGGYAEILRYGPRSQEAFTVRLSIPSAIPVTVDYATAPGSAAAGSDFTPVSGTLTFAPGQTTQTVVVPTLNDTAAEGSEAFSLNLSSAVGATLARGQGIGTIVDDDATKFFVVDDGSTDRTYRYGLTGNALANSTLGSGDTAPRGAAAKADGTLVWVVDANKYVYVYNSSGGLLGSWTAGSVNSSAQLEGIATNGTDIWLVDKKQDNVFRYAGATSRTGGSQNAASSFSVNSGNSNAKGIVTDGTSLWVVDDGSTADKVFKYTLSGSLLGSWTIDAANSSPTGLTINPTNVSDIWIVDSGTKKVYQYTAVANKTSGSQNAASIFALAAGNTNPQDIADPPTADMLLTPAAVSSTSNSQGMTAPSSMSAPSNVVPSSGSPVSAADQLFANFTLLLNDMRSTYQAQLPSVSPLWQSADALALQRLDLLLSMEAGAMGMTRDTPLHDFRLASSSSSNGV
jgi:hypothetical protein